jgi:ABC-type glycerol-3-phosphate transport system permease component
MEIKMGFFDDLFHPGNAYKKAGEREKAGYDEAQGYRNPYLEGGKKAGFDLDEFLNQLKNPADLQNEWAQNYQESPYAKQLLEENQGQGLDAASAMGLNGSSGALSNIHRGAGDIQNKARQQYMDDLMQKYLAGIGIGTNKYNIGANTAGQAAQGAQQHGEWSAQNTLNQQTAGPNLFNSALGAIGSGVGNIFGGPLGGYAADALRNKYNVPNTSNNYGSNYGGSY